MDIFDHATEIEEIHRRAALSTVGIPLHEGKAVWHHGKPHCCECGTVIPLARIKACPTTGLCTDCAEDVEERHRRGE